MPLTMRPTGLGSGIDRDRKDYTVYSGGSASTKPAVAPSIYAGSGPLPFQSPMTRSDRVATFEEAKAHFQKSWDAWKAWAKLEEVP